MRVVVAPTGGRARAPRRRFRHPGVAPRAGQHIAKSATTMRCAGIAPAHERRRERRRAMRVKRMHAPESASARTRWLVNIAFEFATHPSARSALDDIAVHRAWAAAVGALLVALGMVAIVYPVAAAFAAALVLASILVIAGVAECVHAARVHDWRAFVPSLVAGALAVLAGLLLIVFPLPGVLSLTLVLTGYFLLNGVLRSVLALRIRPAPGWGGLLFGGLVSLTLFVIAAFQWPDAAVSLLGLLLGIDLVGDGASLLWLARVAQIRPARPA
jgi:uncharacterized membrane protein HdeD (DUF308 family)